MLPNSYTYKLFNSTYVPICIHLSTIHASLSLIFFIQVIVLYKLIWASLTFTKVKPTKTLLSFIAY
jgi:hypothetical protein